MIRPSGFTQNEQVTGIELNGNELYVVTNDKIAPMLRSGSSWSESPTLLPPEGESFVGPISVSNNRLAGTTSNSQYARQVDVYERPYAGFPRDENQAWGTTYSDDFTLQVSEDGSSFFDIAQVHGDGDLQVVNLRDNTEGFGRWVRIVMNGFEVKPGTGDWGVAIKETSVFRRVHDSCDDQPDFTCTGAAPSHVCQTSCGGKAPGYSCSCDTGVPNLLGRHHPRQNTDQTAITPFGPCFGHFGPATGCFKGFAKQSRHRVRQQITKVTLPPKL